MSADFDHLFCNEASVKNVQAVRRFLSHYESTFVFNVVAAPTVTKTSSGVLKLDDWLDAEWPRAIHCKVLREYSDDLPEAWRKGQELSEDDLDTYEDVVREALWKHGEDGFVKMLSGLARHLSTPLTIQAVSYALGKFHHLSACEWHVKPGDSHVEVNRFRHSLQDEPVLTA